MTNLTRIGTPMPLENTRRVRPDLIVADGDCEEIAQLLHGTVTPVQMVSGMNPLVAITAAMGGGTLDTLHIVAHGRAGGWMMAGQWVDAQALRASEHLLMHWDVKRIALWSCEGGADPALADLLGCLTGAEVLASPAALGYDPATSAREWALTSRTSHATLDARSVFSAASVEAWPHQLVTVTVAGLYRATVSGASDTFFGEETSSVTIDTTAVSTTRVTFSQAGLQFSGNNVLGTVSYVDSNGVTQSFSGLASRPIKVGGVVQGFYVWIDAAPTGGSAADTAWILSVNNTYFNANASIGSSSDRVDSSLNQLIPPNVAPAAVNDVVSFAEGTTGTGNVLTNDSDANGDTLSVTGFSIGTTSYAAGATATVAGKGSLTLNANGSFTFTPVAGYAGAIPDVRYTVSDGTKTASAYLSLTLTPVNDPPVSSNDSVTITEDTATLLGLSDFGTYSDPEGVAIAKVKITTLPTSGALEYFSGTAWTAVTLNQEVTAADIGSGKLRYVPGANGSGNAYATVGFQVSDNGVYSTGTYTLTVNVTPVNDAPAGTDVTVTFNEDTSHTFTAANFGFTDALDSPANALLSVVITSLPATGSLTFNGVAVTAGQTVTAATIGQLAYTPPSNANGNGYASFTFQVRDDGGTTSGGQNLDASPNTLTFNVTAVNDAPAAVDDAAQAIYSTTVGFRSNPTGNVLTNDTDVDGNTLIASRVAAGATLTSPTVIGAARTVTTSTTTTTDITSTELRTYSTFNTNGLGNVPSATYNVSAGNGVPAGTTVTISDPGAGKTFTFNQPVAIAVDTILTLTGPSSQTYTVRAGDTFGTPSSTVFGLSTLVGGTAIVAGMDVTGTGIPNGTKVTSAVTAGDYTLVTLDTTPTSFNATFSASDWHFTSSTTTTTTTTVSDGTSVITGTYGTLTIRPNGSYDYAVTNTAVTNGSTDQFTYEVSDGRRPPRY